jgi:hypothetical protein
MPTDIDTADPAIRQTTNTLQHYHPGDEGPWHMVRSALGRAHADSFSRPAPVSIRRLWLPRCGAHVYRVALCYIWYTFMPLVSGVSRPSYCQPKPKLLGRSISVGISSSSANQTRPTGFGFAGAGFSDPKDRVWVFCVPYSLWRRARRARQPLHRSGSRKLRPTSHFAYLASPASWKDICGRFMFTFAPDLVLCTPAGNTFSSPALNARSPVLRVLGLYLLTIFTMWPMWLMPESPTIMPREGYFTPPTHSPSLGCHGASNTSIFTSMLCYLYRPDLYDRLEALWRV